ncbi:MAG: hypothetical protein HZA65_05595, partial [Rhodocyclales bacterium]|nr:hypothetical protein [Rhodocyclales bacterium]
MAAHLAKVNVPLYLRDKRARKQARYRRRAWKAKAEASEHDADLDRLFGKSSKIVALLASGPPSEEVLRRRSFRFQMPGTFSVLDRPDAALATISDLASQLRAQRLGSIYLDFTKVVLQDLGANGLLDVLVDEQQTQARRANRTLRWRGTFPKSAADRRFMRAMGVIKRLQITHEYLQESEAASIVLFNERCKHYTRTEKPTQTDRKSRVTQRFADHINDCLKRVGRRLTPAARSRLCQYIGEIIDNAEQHGRMGDWSIQGYLDTGVITPMCEIVIFNFGRTIAQGFEELPADSYPRQQVQRYIDLHAQRKFFQREWRREDLFTLIALQGGVSTKNESAQDTRGNGTVDLITFFQRIEPPR